MKIAAAGSMVVLASLCLEVGVAGATPDMIAKLKQMGVQDAKNCQFCHTEALPKKATFKPEALNDRGKFLLEDMQKRSLKAADLQKLKEFNAQK